MSFAIGSQQADTCLGEGSAGGWLGTALNMPDSPGPRQSREAAVSILVSTCGECRGRKEREQDSGRKPQADKHVGFNVKTRLGT